MKKTSISLMLIILGFLLITNIGVASAGSSFRCSESRLVSYGDKPDQVLKNCGRPSEMKELVNGFNQVIGTRWIYNFSIYGNQQTTTIDYYFDGRMGISGK